MAQAYAAPEGFEPPEITTDDFRNNTWEAKEKAYLDRLAARCRENGSSPLLGEVIRFPRGDGYAQYMVWTTQPLAFIWLELGDAWQVEDALIRGLRVKDVKDMVDRSARMAELFGRK